MQKALLTCVTGVMLSASSLAAQQMANGVWRGEWRTADGETMPVSFLVAQRNGRQTLTLVARGQPEVVMGGLKLQKGWKLSFTWAAGGGALYFCSLTRRDPDGPFDGRCEDNRVMVGSGPVRASLTIFPPQSGANPGSP